MVIIYIIIIIIILIIISKIWQFISKFVENRKYKKKLHKLSYLVKDKDINELKLKLDILSSNYKKIENDLNKKYGNIFFEDDLELLEIQPYLTKYKFYQKHKSGRVKIYRHERWRRF